MLVICCIASSLSGDDVLSWLSFGHTSIRKTLGSEARILGFYYWLTYCILKAGKPRFQLVEAPGPAAVAQAAAHTPANAEEVDRTERVVT